MDELRDKREKVDAEMMALETKMNKTEEEINELNDQISCLHTLDPESNKLKVGLNIRLLYGHGNEMPQAAR